jgi:hypothetical protein
MKAKAEKEEVAIVTMVTSAEKQAIRLRRMPMFFENPRNGKEIKDFCHFGSRKGKGYRVRDAESKKCRILKQVIPIRRQAERELVVNDDNQRFGIPVISMSVVISLTLD